MDTTTTITLEMPAKHLQVLILLEQGKTQKEISKEIFTSVANVERIIGSMLQNFDSRNRTQLVAKAIRRGII